MKRAMVSMAALALLAGAVSLAAPDRAQAGGPGFFSLSVGNPGYAGYGGGYGPGYGGGGYCGQPYGPVVRRSYVYAGYPYGGPVIHYGGYAGYYGGYPDYPRHYGHGGHGGHGGHDGHGGHGHDHD